MTLDNHDPELAKLEQELPGSSNLVEDIRRKIPPDSHQPFDLRSFVWGAVTSLGLAGVVGGGVHLATQPSKNNRDYDTESAVLRAERERLARQWKLYHSNPPYPYLEGIRDFNRKARGFNSMLDASDYDSQRRGLLRVIPIDPKRPDMDRYPDADELLPGKTPSALSEVEPVERPKGYPDGTFKPERTRDSAPLKLPRSDLNQDLKLEFPGERDSVLEFPGAEK